ncbi:AlbA family DNA-binding domain-containing protein [Roseibium sediminicola]|uniref:ATP-binding protein n=1 Tax=Roseibium sediminicola TaxID=2933272 RepID=A0ABT0GQ44_9HYPH|nr:ATP-binding protein [Roseibium sp. CAU 1639]MCK7611555.1 ATP-binding protein [Roseibium sp. CAU 1639]
MIDWTKELYSRGEAGIRSLIGQAESFEVEFKAKDDPSSTSLSNNDKKNIAKEVAGFANASGGVLIFGVKTKTDPASQQDVASELQPIAEIEKLSASIKSVLFSNVNPPLTDAEILIVRSDVDPGKGYALIYIPQSESGPHMSTAKGEHRYYRRIGEQTLLMDHRMVRDMMLSQRSANFEVGWEIGNTSSVVGNGKKNYRGSLSLIVRNCSAVTAQAPFFQISTDPALKALERDLHGFRLFQTNLGTVEVAGGNDVLLHPMATRKLNVFTISFSVLKAAFESFIEHGGADYFLQDHHWTFGGEVYAPNIRLNSLNDGLDINLICAAKNAVPKELCFELERQHLIKLASIASLGGEFSTPTRFSAIEFETKKLPSALIDERAPSISQIGL